MVGYGREGCAGIAPPKSSMATGVGGKQPLIFAF